jgi:hypothetical protein
MGAKTSMTAILRRWRHNVVRVELLSGPQDGAKVESPYGETFIYTANPTARYIVRDVFADTTYADHDQDYAVSIHLKITGNGDGV